MGLGRGASSVPKQGRVGVLCARAELCGPCAVWSWRCEGLALCDPWGYAVPALCGPWLCGPRGCAGLALCDSGALRSSGFAGLALCGRGSGAVQRCLALCSPRATRCSGSAGLAQRSLGAIRSSGCASLRPCAGLAAGGGWLRGPAQWSCLSMKPPSILPEVPEPPNLRSLRGSLVL